MPSAGNIPEVSRSLRALKRAARATRPLLAFSAALLAVQAAVSASEADPGGGAVALALLSCATAILLFLVTRQLYRLRSAARTLEEAMAAACAADAPPAALAWAQPAGQLWNETRLAELSSELGADGLRDLLRLFQADAPHVLAQLSRAVAAGDEASARRTLDALRDAASGLGLASVAALADAALGGGIEPSLPARLAAEIALAGTLPHIKKAA